MPARCPINWRSVTGHCFSWNSGTSLALGIGATTAAFAVLDAFMLRGLPVREPERLVAFSTAGSPGWATWPYAPYEHWTNSPDRLFEAAAASNPRTYDVPLRGTETTAQVRVSLVSGNYLQVAGVDLALGRPLTGADALTPGASAVAVISHAFWQRWYGGAGDIVGKTIDCRASATKSWAWRTRASPGTSSGTRRTSGSR